MRAGGFLVALSVPALQLRMVTPGPDTFPQSLPVVQTYNQMQQAFPGSALPANVVVKAPNVNAPAVREAIDQLGQRALASGRMHEPITVDVNKDATVANITVPIDGKGTDAESNASLAALRDENRADPESRLIALPLIRIRAQSDHPAKPIFRLEGGPGTRQPAGSRRPAAR